MGWTLPGAAAAATVDDLSAGGGQTCAVMDSGEVWCWGASLEEMGSDRPTPRPIEGIRDAVAVSVGTLHACARRAGGRVSCWGHNGNGQLGNGKLNDRMRREPVAVVGAPPLVEVHAGAYFTCGRAENGEVWCWGGNGDGQAAPGGPELVRTPQRVLTDATALAVGGWHACATMRDGALSCWGSDDDGQRGDGDAAEGGIARLELGPIRGISLGWAHSCALLEDGQLRCWGDGWYGQLGGANQEDQPAPAPGPSIPGAVAVSAGAHHSCASTADGAVWCWGADEAGEAGVLPPVERLEPTVVDGIEGAIAVSAGTRYSCARRAEGPPVCWGDNFLGQLGRETSREGITPVSTIPRGVGVVTGLP